MQKLIRSYLNPGMSISFLKTIDELLQVFGNNLKNSLYLKSSNEIRKDKEEEENGGPLISKK